MKTATRAALGLAVLLTSAIALGADRYTCRTAERVASQGWPISGCIGPQLKNGREWTPAPTAAENDAIAKAKHDAEVSAQLRKNAARADEQFVAEYPNETLHRQAREADLAPIRAQETELRTRLKQLAAERVPLTKEAEFYRTEAARPLWLRDALAANDAKVSGTKDRIRELERDEADINAKRDAELARLRKLWSGAASGSIATAATSARRNSN